MFSINRSLALGGAALAAAIAGIAVMLSLGGPAGPAGASEESGAAALEGGEWTLVSLDGEKVLAEGEVSAQFDGGQLSGAASVNRYFGSYTVNGAQLSISTIGSTKMAGPEPLMQQEQSFLSALATASSFSRSGQTLTITTDSGDLVFNAK